ncbi:hypothetical protein QTN47_27155 [Danxiaibacter flavus]|uniref:HTH cro/C1-type domain-containing protein n=1 Tax=Danxiaibacter flavus TaxID=3049108 RepID=A0ABV3ZQG1_9BACT|nr:hypothetical protein QNM32_27155 [Chitinophagaceae bacterium DXS]
MSDICVVIVTNQNNNKKMAKQRISDKAITAIRQDNGLCAAVCDAIGIKVISIDRYIRRMSNSLTSHHVVKIIADRTGLSIEEILEDRAELSTNV